MTIDHEIAELEAENLLHEMARALMDTRPDLTQMSLDEWLVEHAEKLDDAEKRAATAILEMF